MLKLRHEMDVHRAVTRACSLAALAGAGLLAPGLAFAQTPVGGATMIQNEVLGHTGGGITKLHRGDTVFKDQLVQTAAQSRAKIVFLDTTNMAVGPESIVRLDEFVYNGNGTASRVTFNATKGAFRFISGASPSNAYQVRTPQAVIGVRGTTYDVRVSNGQTYIKLQEGAITACTVSQNQCRDLNTPGESLIVNDTSIEGPFPASASRWDFGDLCAGAGAAELCGRQTRFALNNPPPPPSGGNFTPPPMRRADVRPPPVRYLPPVMIDPPVRVIQPLPPAYPPVVIAPPPGCRPYGRRGCGPDVNPPRPPKPPVNPCGHGYRSRGCDNAGKPQKPGRPVIGRPDRPGHRPPVTRPPRMETGKYRPGANRPRFDRPRYDRPRFERQRSQGQRLQGQRNFGPRNYGSRLAGPRVNNPRMNAPHMNSRRTTGPRTASYGGRSRQNGGSRNGGLR